LKRWTARILGGIALFFVLALAFTLRPVDRSWPVGEDYYVRTMQALARELKEAPACSAEPLEAGVGKAGLTPAVGVPLAGYGDRRGRPSTGVHDSLFVRALALRSGECGALFLALEALIVLPEVAERVLDSLGRDPGLEEREVYFSATHTHSGAGGWGRGPVQKIFAGGFNPSVVEMFVDSTVAAARRAWRDLGPAEIGWEQFAAAQYTANRLVGPLGTIDSLFSFVAVRRRQGILAVVGSYPAHATVLSGENFLFSGDWPGAWSRALEERGVRCALFLAGGVGSHRPRGPGRGFERAEAIGRALADSVLAHLGSLRWEAAPELRTASVNLRLGGIQLRVSQNVRLASWLGGWLTRARSARVSAVKLGNVWLSAPADWSGELTNELRCRLGHPGLGFTVTSFNGGYIGYVVPDRYYDLNEYETRLMSFYGPHTATYLTLIYKRILRAWAPD